MRLDLVDGLIEPGSLTIEPVIDLCRPLEPQLLSVRRLDALLHGDCPLAVDQRLIRLVEALRTADALAAGASLRDIGEGMFGGDWPGDGEHVKSRVRRRVVLADALLRAGSLGVLARAI